MAAAPIVTEQEKEARYYLEVQRFFSHQDMQDAIRKVYDSALVQMIFNFGWDRLAVYRILFAHGRLWTNFNEDYKRKHGSVPKSAGPYPVSNMDRVRRFILPEVARFVDSNEDFDYVDCRHIWTRILSSVGDEEHQVPTRIAGAVLMNWRSLKEKRFAAGIYTLLKGHLQGKTEYMYVRGSDSMKLLVKFLFINVNRTEILDFFALVPECMEMMKTKKRTHFLDAYRSEDLKIIMWTVKHLDLSVGDMEPPAGKPPVLWLACDGQDVEGVRHLMRLRSIQDSPAPDGTTGMAAALGRLNPEIVRMLLERFSEGEAVNFHQAQYLAQEFLKDTVEPGVSKQFTYAKDLQKILRMRETIRDALDVNGDDDYVQDDKDMELDYTLVELAREYPLVDEKAENEWPVNREIEEKIFGCATELQIDLHALDEYILDELCLEIPSRSMALRDIILLRCNHKEGSSRHYNCIMIHDLVRFSKALEKDLCETKGTPLSNLLKPEFHLIGSIPEGTRIGLANEMDISVRFKSCMGRGVFEIYDAFTMKRSANDENRRLCNELGLKKYFNDDGTFARSSFLEDFYSEVTISAERVMEGQDNLRIVQTNAAHHECEKCTQNVIGEHCQLQKQNKDCGVFVSQSRVGICLQFIRIDEKGKEAYCSIDLIPMFEIEAILDTDLATIINNAMLGFGHPKCWIKYLFSYFKTLQIIDVESEIEDDTTRRLTSVATKQINCHMEKSFYVKPGQILGGKKIEHKGMRKAYCYLKALKKILCLDISSFWIKKQLMSRPFRRMADEWGDLPDCILFDIMHSEQFKSLFEEVIDFDRWEMNSEWAIPRRNTFHSVDLD